ncbi:permease [Geosporobacter ferrireducens]|uniref:Permease n=1 Tax=Geosporobacter ferrireducens TaxID=1424294 RepID=A0A1D8GN29_9FIRM|nr:permease [Geosporobacter ferrireducens]AOT72315.1 permease [Geosporobacter ferrireducens]
MNKFIKKHVFFLSVITVNLFILIFFPQTGKKSFVFTGKIFSNFLLMLTPIFICTGLLDVWVEKEAMHKIMGEESGMGGILVSFLLGMVTAVPLYALLPMAGMLLKKGSKLLNVLIFICSCTSIRIPLLLFEASSMGWKLTITRFIANIFIVLIIAFVTDFVLTKEDKKELYDSVSNL